MQEPRYFENKDISPGRDQSIQELCGELRRAITALGANDIDTLERSIVLQEGLAERLECCLKGECDSHEALPLRELSSLTRIYSGLLHRSLRSVRLRSALYRTYKQIFPENKREQSGNWSCEA